MTMIRSGTLRQFATFQAVARLGSVSMAADELHLSQSAASIQIASLEEAIGAPLIERTGRGVRLTEAGDRLLLYADRMLALWQETTDEMALFHGAFAGSLRVGAVSTAEYWLPRLLLTFMSDHPKVRLKLHSGNRGDIVGRLASHDIDIAVMGRPPEELKVEAAWVAKNPMGFVAAPHHPLMHAPSLSMPMLAEAHLLVRERGSGSRNTVERLFKEANLRLRIGSELSSNEVIKQMCAAGFGPAYLSVQACALELRAGVLQLLPMANNPVERDWYSVRLAARQLPPVAMAFERFLSERGQSEIHRHVLTGPVEASPALGHRPSLRRAQAQAQGQAKAGAASAAHCPTMPPISIVMPLVPGATGAD